MKLSVLLCCVFYGHLLWCWRSRPFLCPFKMTKGLTPCIPVVRNLRFGVGPWPIWWCFENHFISQLYSPYWQMNTVCKLRKRRYCTFLCETGWPCGQSEHVPWGPWAWMALFNGRKIQHIQYMAEILIIIESFGWLSDLICIPYISCAVHSQLCLAGVLDISIRHVVLWPLSYYL